MKLQDILYEKKAALPSALKASVKDLFEGYVEPVFDDMNDSGLDIKIADLNGSGDGFVPFYDGGMNISLTIPAETFLSSGSFPKVIKSDLEEIQADMDEEGEDETDAYFVADVTVSLEKEKITVGGGFEDDRGKPYNSKSYTEESANYNADDIEATSQEVLIAITKVLKIFK